METKNSEELTGLDYYYIEYVLKDYVNTLSPVTSLRGDIEALLEKVRRIRRI